MNGVDLTAAVANCSDLRSIEGANDPFRHIVLHNILEAK